MKKKFSYICLSKGRGKGKGKAGKRRAKEKKQLKKKGERDESKIERCYRIGNEREDGEFDFLPTERADVCAAGAGAGQEAEVGNRRTLGAAAGFDGEVPDDAGVLQLFPEACFGGDLADGGAG